MADRQATDIENRGTGGVLNRISKNNKISVRPRYINPQDSHPRKDSDASKSCYKCGMRWPHPAGEVCPAIGKTCKRCKKSNHFMSVCRSSSVNQLHDSKIVQDNRCRDNMLSESQPQESQNTWMTHQHA